jgi:hypothetical protein
MPFPRKLLTSDEELVLDLRPHWVALVGPVLVTLLIIAAWIFLITLDNLPGEGDTERILTWIVLGAGVLLFIVYPLRAFIAWVTSHFVVTNERVIHRQGLIAKNSMEIPLDRINDVRFNQTVIERMIGAGDLLIESAGERGQNVFSDIRHPEDVQKVIYERAEVHTMRMQGGMAGAPAAPSATEELTRLADLRDRGAITEEEYQAHKARLLGGS